MKEITFLKQNEKKWTEYENKLNNTERIDPAELTNMFVELTDDLSYSNTNFPQTRTQAYVNNLASKVHHLVYKNRKESGGRFVNFYVYEVPMFFSKYHKQLFYSFLIFGLATFLGVALSLIHI